MTCSHLPRWSALPALCLLGFSPLFAQTFSSQQFVVPTTLKISSGRGYTASEFSGIDGFADFNRDGRMDILTNYNPPSGAAGVESAILFRDSDGSYTPELVGNLSGGQVGNTTGLGGQIADVNGDGIPDIVSISSPPVGDKDNGCDPDYPCGDAYLSVSLGNGNGTFRTSNLDLGNTFAGLALVTDFNKDGKPDLLISETGYASPFTFTVWTNQGGGKFKASSVSFTGTYGAGDIISGDFNGDGYADVAVITNQGTEQVVQILLNNKGTGFSPAISYPIVTSQSLTTLATGDLNGDGKLDLVATDFAGGGHILLGNGNGTFRMGSTFNISPTQQPASTADVNLIKIADVNGDGYQDISFVAYAADGNKYLEVFAGTGKGTVGYPTVYNLGVFGNFGGEDAQLADLNGNGRLDCLLSGPDDFYIASNQGSGSFHAPRQNNSTYPPSSIVTADFNGDGKGDVAFVRSYYTGTDAYATCDDPSFRASVAVYPGTGQGYFGPQHVYPIGMPAGVIAAGDVNGDGIPDLVIARSAQYVYMYNCQQTSTDLSVLLGNGDGTFRPAKNYSVLGAPASADRDNFIELADMNHDGKLDLIGDWGVALGKGDGSFDPPTPLPLPSGSINQIAAGDFNKDGTLDLAVGRSIFYNGGDIGASLYILLGDGKGSFTVKGQVPTSTTFGIGALAVADMNKDGNLDLIYDNFDGLGEGLSLRNITVVLGNGNGTFGTPINYALDPNGFTDTAQMLIADFNRDGLPDVLYLGQAALPGKSALSPLMLLTGTGGGHLNTTPQYYSPNFTSGVVLDVNGDGAPDVVGTTYTGITRLLNTGSRK